MEVRKKEVSRMTHGFPHNRDAICWDWILQENQIGVDLGYLESEVCLIYLRRHLKRWVEWMNLEFYGDGWRNLCLIRLCRGGNWMLMWHWPGTRRGPETGAWKMPIPSGWARVPHHVYLIAINSLSFWKHLLGQGLSHLPCSSCHSWGLYYFFPILLDYNRAYCHFPSRLQNLPRCCAVIFLKD